MTKGEKTITCRLLWTSSPFLFVVCYLDLWRLGLFKDNLHIKCSLRAEQEEQASAWLHWLQYHSCCLCCTSCKRLFFFTDENQDKSNAHVAKAIMIADDPHENHVPAYLTLTGFFCWLFVINFVSIFSPRLCHHCGVPALHFSRWTFVYIKASCIGDVGEFDVLGNTHILFLSKS